MVAREGVSTKMIDHTQTTILFAAHILLSAKRHKGEWFNVSLEEAIAAVNRAVAMVEAGEIAAPAKCGPQANVIGVRFERDEREALQQAAAADERSLSALIRIIVVRWLREKGYLK